MTDLRGDSQFQQLVMNWPNSTADIAKLFTRITWRTKTWKYMNTIQWYIQKYIEAKYTIHTYIYTNLAIKDSSITDKNFFRSFFKLFQIENFQILIKEWFTWRLNFCSWSKYFSSFGLKVRILARIWKPNTQYNKQS